MGASTSIKLLLMSDVSLSVGDNSFAWVVQDIAGCVSEDELYCYLCSRESLKETQLLPDFHLLDQLAKCTAFGHLAV